MEPSQPQNFSLSGTNPPQPTPAPASSQSFSRPVIQQPAQASQPAPQVTQSSQPAQPAQSTQPAQPAQPTPVNHLANATQTVKDASKTLFPVMKDLLKKPITTLQTQMTRFDDSKAVFTVAIFVTVLATLLNTLRYIITMAYIPATKGFFGVSTSAKFSFDNIKFGHIPSFIFQSLIFYAALLGVISLVYFLAASVIHKKVSFIRCLGVSSVAIMPFVVCSILFPLLTSYLYHPLGDIVYNFGIIYSMLILLSGMNHALELGDNDQKIFIHLIGITVISASFTILTNTLFNQIYRSPAGGFSLDSFSLFNSILPFLW